MRLSLDRHRSSHMWVYPARTRSFTAKWNRSRTKRNVASPSIHPRSRIFFANISKRIFVERERDEMKREWEIGSVFRWWVTNDRHYANCRYSDACVPRYAPWKWMERTREIGTKSNGHCRLWGMRDSLAIICLHLSPVYLLSFPCFFINILLRFLSQVFRFFLLSFCWLICSFLIMKYIRCMI